MPICVIHRPSVILVLVQQLRPELPFVVTISLTNSQTIYYSQQTSLTNRLKTFLFDADIQQCISGSCKFGRYKWHNYYYYYYYNYYYYYYPQHSLYLATMQSFTVLQCLNNNKHLSNYWNTANRLELINLITGISSSSFSSLQICCLSFIQEAHCTYNCCTTMTRMLQNKYRILWLNVQLLH